MKKIVSFALIMCFMGQMEAMNKLSILTKPSYSLPAEVQTAYQDAFFKVFSKDNIGYVAQRGGVACSKIAKYSYRGVSWTAQTAYDHPVAASCLAFATIGVGYACYKLPSRRSLLNMRDAIESAVDESGERIENGVRETTHVVVTELGKGVDQIDRSIEVAHGCIELTETILVNLETKREALRVILNDAALELATAKEEKALWLVNLQEDIGDKIEKVDAIAKSIKRGTEDEAIIKEALGYIEDGNQLINDWNDFRDKQTRLALLVQGAYGLAMSLDKDPSADENKKIK